ncbi:MAG: hypothetical protein WD511_00120 [Balneolaceae bacterium]
MKTMKKYIPLLFLSGVLLISCSITEQSTSVYNEDVAQGTGNNIVDITESIFNRFSFTVRRTTRTDNRIMYESDWKNRLLFPSEDSLGFSEVRNKLIIEARPYMRTELTERRVYNVKFSGITEYRREGDSNWYSEDINADAENFLQEITYELKTELERVLYQ